MVYEEIAVPSIDEVQPGDTVLLAGKAVLVQDQIMVTLPHIHGVPDRSMALHPEWFAGARRLVLPAPATVPAREVIEAALGAYVDAEQLGDAVEVMTRMLEKHVEDEPVPAPPAAPPDVAKGVIEMIADKADAESRATAFEHIATEVFTERARLIAFLASVYPSRIGPDPEQPDYYVVIVDTPVGQMAWHVSDADRLDRHLFDHVSPATPSDEPLNGHTAEDKYDRLVGLIGLNDAAPWDTHEAFFDKAEVGAVRKVLGAVRAVIESPRAMGFRQAEGAPSKLVVFVDDVEAALAGEPVAMAQPGPLRWKFDGGRGAMVDLRDKIVGYYKGGGPLLPGPNALTEAIYDVLEEGTARNADGHAVAKDSNLAVLANQITEAVTTKATEQN